MPAKPTRRYQAPPKPTVRTVSAGQLVNIDEGSARVENRTNRVLTYMLAMVDGDGKRIGQASLTLGANSDRDTDGRPQPIVSIDPAALAALTEHPAFASDLQAKRISI